MSLVLAFAACDDVEVCCLVLLLLYFLGPAVSEELCAVVVCELLLLVVLPELVVCADTAPTIPTNKIENAILFID